jgi:hypothetical protein
MKLIKKTVFMNTNGPLLTVWRFLKIGRLSFCVHKFDQADEDPDCHDHPFHFVTLILKGGYFEEMHHLPFKRVYINRVFPRYRWSLLFRKATCLHRVHMLMGNKPCWTLCIKWDAKCTWGFMTKNGWQHWKTYIKNKGLTPNDKSEDAF